jgi:alkanesulfonate monooxygenase SsuD/methylene tetrahydromethanopterin reductase-like flavin-dependent oxidoreductase (luciferase family)
MAANRRVEFAYIPYSVNRAGGFGRERIDERTYLDDLQRALDLASEHFSSFWLSDHFLTKGQFLIEAWTTLVWMAARYPKPMLGTHVLSASHRNPALLAKMVATFQVLSRGRFILGYGAGSDRWEHAAAGLEFPRTPIRIAKMIESLKLMRALWTEAPARFQGTYYRLTDAYCVPRPDPIPPIVIGGHGEKYLLRAVAEYADGWIGQVLTKDVSRHKLAVLKQHCQDLGRDYDSIVKSYPLVTFLAKTQSEAEQRAGSWLGRGDSTFIGEPARMRDYLSEMIEMGFTRFQLFFANFPELDDMRLFVEKVLPSF